MCLFRPRCRFLRGLAKSLGKNPPTPTRAAAGGSMFDRGRCEHRCTRPMSWVMREANPFEQAHHSFESDRLPELVAINRLIPLYLSIIFLLAFRPLDSRPETNRIGHSDRNFKFEISASEFVFWHPAKSSGREAVGLGRWGVEHRRWRVVPDGQSFLHWRIGQFESGGSSQIRP